MEGLRKRRTVKKKKQMFKWRSSQILLFCEGACTVGCFYESPRLLESLDYPRIAACAQCPLLCAHLPVQTVAVRMENSLNQATPRQSGSKQLPAGKATKIGTMSVCILPFLAVREVSTRARLGWGRLGAEQSSAQSVPPCSTCARDPDGLQMLSLPRR